MTDEDDDWWDDSDPLPDDDMDVDVCQHCGGYFAWTEGLRKAWVKHWNPGPNDRQPQRCHRCVVNETWIEQ